MDRLGADGDRASRHVPVNPRGTTVLDRFKEAVPFVTLIVTVFAFVFGLGVNWRSITENRVKTEALEASIPATYVRRDVYDADKEGLKDAINRLNATLERISSTSTEPRQTPVFGK
jgi:hypothetical protein